MPQRRRNGFVQVGHQFGRWTVVEAPRLAKRDYRVICRCECGHTHDCVLRHLERGLSTGCVKCARKRLQKHPEPVPAIARRAGVTPRAVYAMIEKYGWHVALSKFEGRHPELQVTG